MAGTKKRGLAAPKRRIAGPNAAASSIEALMRQRVENSQGASLVLGAKLRIPEVAAPSLEDLDPERFRLPPPERDELLAALFLLQRTHAEVTAREPGAKVERGDEVLVDHLAVENRPDGGLIPFTVAKDRWLALQPEPPFEEDLGAQILGNQLTVGSQETVGWRVPKGFPKKAWRGQSVKVLLHIKAACAVSLPQLDDPAFLAAINLGANQDEVLTALHGDLLHARTKPSDAVLLPQVLDALVERAQPVVDDEMLDESIKVLWLEFEGRLLTEWSIPMEKGERALKGWQKHKPTRRGVTEYLKRAAVIRAIGEEMGLDITAGSLLAPVAALATAARGDPDPLVTTAPTGEELSASGSLEKSAEEQVLEHILKTVRKRRRGSS